MTPMLVELEKVENITLCCLALHSYLRSSPTSRETYAPESTFYPENHVAGIVGDGGVEMARSHQWVGGFHRAASWQQKLS